MKSLMIFSILVALVSTGQCFKCYVGIGDVGDALVTEEDGFKSCSLVVTESGGTTVAVRSGSSIEMDEGCNNVTLPGVSTRTCYCNSELCNNAPACEGCFKCYVGAGDVGDAGVTEEDGFKSCVLTVAGSGDSAVASRSGSPVEMEEGCASATIQGVETKTCYCNSELCNNAPACEGCFKCYVGPGDVGDALVTEEDGFKSCVLTVAEASGQEAKVRSGSPTELDEGCDSVSAAGGTLTTCNCNSELCNNAPATAQAFMPILAMAMLVKLMF